jgi:hypothetical protein
VLTDPIKRARYDEMRDSSRQMYSYGYGFTDIDSDLLQLDGNGLADYDLAWDEFISKPFEWMEKSLRVYYRWEFVCGVTFVVGIIAWLMLGYRFSVLEFMRFLVTTQSAPTVESYIPANVAAIGIALGIVITLVSTAYAAITHPYSIRYSATFRHHLIDLSSNMLAVLTMINGTVGVVIGHYLF